MFELQSPEAICKVLGARVRALRLARNLSQSELADMCNVSLSGVRRLESQGQGSLSLLVKAALALNATDTLAPLFAAPVLSIAQAQSAAQMATRRRARSARRKV